MRARAAGSSGEAPKSAHRARARLRDAEEQLDERGLAGAVGADQAERRPSLDAQASAEVADGLDVDDPGPLEAEVMLWRICSAKSIPDAAIRRAISEEWESEG